MNNLHQLEREEAKQIPLVDIVELWRGNHKIMLEYLQSTEIPFFGLHGTTGEGLAGILHEGQTKTLNLATFYDKRKDEFRLYQFYAMCRYVAGFTRRDSQRPGKVMVFNVERSGRNPTMDYKYISGTGGLDVELTPDTEAETEMRSRLQDPENRLRRTLQGFGSKESFAQSYLGAIDVSRLRDEVGTGMDEYSKSIALRRIDTQYDLGNVFDMIKSNKDPSHLRKNQNGADRIYPQIQNNKTTLPK